MAQIGSNNNQTFTDRIILEKECREITGHSRTTRWEMEKRGDFPKRRKIGLRRVGWLLSEIVAWMHALEVVDISNTSPEQENMV